MFVQTDVAEEESVCRMVDQAVREFGNVCALCNNAAIEIAKDFRDSESHEWDRILAVNLRSVYLCARGTPAPHRIRCWRRCEHLVTCFDRASGCLCRFEGRNPFYD